MPVPLARAGAGLAISHCYHRVRHFEYIDSISKTSPDNVATSGPRLQPGCAQTRISRPGNPTALSTFRLTPRSGKAANSTRVTMQVTDRTIPAFVFGKPGK